MTKEQATEEASTLQDLIGKTYYNKRSKSHTRFKITRVDVMGVGLEGYEVHVWVDSLDGQKGDIIHWGNFLAHWREDR